MYNESTPSDGQMHPLETSVVVLTHYASYAWTWNVNCFLWIRNV